MVDQKVLRSRMNHQYGNRRFMCRMGDSTANEILKNPETILVMMKEIATSILEARKANIGSVLVEFPLPVTGGTELDEWPGGIKQKYATLLPMLAETMKSLDFSASAIEARLFLGGGGGEEDAVGIWNHKDINICCFPTEESIPFLKAIIKEQTLLGCSDSSRDSMSINASSADDMICKTTGVLVIVNQQFFLDPLSNQQSKDFLNDIPTGYVLESLNMRGPGALPVRGILYRQYPHPFKVRNADVSINVTIVYLNLHICKYFVCITFISQSTLQSLILLSESCIMCKYEIFIQQIIKLSKFNIENSQLYIAS
jgi:hypothetical protein